MGAGVGIKTGGQDDGTWLVAIDADTLATPLAATVAMLIYEQYGADTPTRIGQAPKALYVVRLDGPMPYSRIEFADGGDKPARVELLSDGRQFVAAGVHPGTGRPYEWTVGLLPYVELPVRHTAQLA